MNAPLTHRFGRDEVDNCSCPSSLWPLVSDRPLPRVHVLSDLHQETAGPYEIPAYARWGRSGHTSENGQARTSADGWRGEA